jgi:hypothetical protein
MTATARQHLARSPVEVDFDERRRAIEVLQADIAFIDRRLAELELVLPRLRDNDRQQAALLEERSATAAHRRVLAQKLKELTDPVERARLAANRTRSEALRQRRAEAYRESCLEAAADFESKHDYDNAVRWRLEALRARQVAEKEIA